MTIYFVTGNKEKLREAKGILHDFEIEQINIDLPELQGEPEDIVKEKAKLAADKARKPVFVEDSSLCFDALNGLPGPYVKDFIKKIGVPGLSELAGKYENNSAVVLASIGYCEPGKEPLVFQGKVKGKIVSPRGDTRFQWDQIFMPEGHDKTFSQMTVEKKNEISHRRKAFEEFRKWLKKKHR